MSKNEKFKELSTDDLEKVSGGNLSLQMDDPDSGERFELCEFKETDKALKEITIGNHAIINKINDHTYEVNFLDEFGNESITAHSEEEALNIASKHLKSKPFIE